MRLRESAPPDAREVADEGFGPPRVGRRVVALNLLRDRIDAVGRNDISGKRCPACTVGVTRVGVVDHRRNRAEIAGLESVGRNRVEAGRSLALPRAVEAQEVEQLVLLDGAADGAAEIVVDGQRLIGSRGLEERARVEVLVVVELKCAAEFRLVGDRLSRRLTTNPPSPARRRPNLVVTLTTLMFSSGATISEAHGAAPHVHAGGAVNSGNVGLGVASVDVRGEGAARSIGDRVLQRRRQCAVHQVRSTIDSCDTSDRRAGDGSAVDLWCVSAFCLP